MTTVIDARQLSKHYGKKIALDAVDLQIARGQIIGLIGPNGAGKTTLIKALLGLTPFTGHLSVLGYDPQRARNQLMNEVCFIADVAILPRWISVKQAADYVQGTHPRFDRTRFEKFIAGTQLTPKLKVKQMSKGMVAQLHLALVMAIDAQLLVLDEPTLGLDILYREQFYQRLLEDYFDAGKTILITTHQVEEIENILTDVIFIRDGRVVLHDSMQDIGQRYSEVLVDADKHARALALNPLDSRTQPFGKHIMLFENVPTQRLAELGEIRTPNLADLFVATMKGAYA